jgi:mono/diheme cytochrome c family protein
MALSENLTPTEAKEREMRLITVEQEAAMRGRTTALVFSVTLLGFAAGIAIRARGAGQGHASDQPRSELERARLLAAGKELFMARCARCHDERGDKALKTGPPLNERGLSMEEVARAVNGRLRDKTAEERRAVTLYISSLMKIKDSEERAAPKP